MRQGRFILVLGIIFFLLLPCRGLAETPERKGDRASRWYLSATGGVNEVDDMETISGLDLEFNNGYFFSLAAGRDFGFWRVELEGTLSRNEVHKTTYFDTTIGNSGDVSVAGLMLNGYLEWDNSTRFIPYIGIGLGAARLSFNDIRDEEGQEIFDDSDVGEAVQVMLGVDFRVTDRFLAGLRFQGQGIYDIKFTDENTGHSRKEDYDSFATVLALQYRF